MSIRPAVFLLAACLIAAGAARATAPAVVVNPFELYNVSDLESLAPGLQSVLASRLQGDGYEVRTPSEQGTGDGEWVVNTTLTRLGKVLSVDASLVPADASLSGARTYETVGGPDELLPALERVAERLKQALTANLARRPAVPAPPMAAHPAPPAAPPQGPVSAPAPSPIPSTGAGPVADLPTVLSRQRGSAEVEGDARGLVVADTDGDGTAEVVMLLADRLEGYADLAGTIEKVWEHAVPEVEEPLALSAADLDGDGRVELFVAGQTGFHPVTQAYEWSDMALRPKGGRTAAFLRAVHHPLQGSMLLGRKAAIGKDLFQPGVRHFGWEAGAYRPGEAFAPPFPLPAINREFVQFQADGPVYSVVTTQDDGLVIYDAEGNLVYEVEETIKGTVLKLRGEEKTAGLMDEDIVYVSGSSAAWVGPDGTPYLMLYKNTGGVGRLFKRLSSFSNSHLLAYRWDGLGMSKAGQSATYSGYIPDLAMRSAGVGTDGATLYAVLVRHEGLLNQRSLSRVLAYDLP